MHKGERFNSITHLVGSALALIGTIVLVALTAGQHNPRKLTAIAIYGAMMLVLYLSSTLYHSLHHGKAKNVFHTMDHCAIYLLIAGTYTPFTLVTLHGVWGWSLFGVVWTLAAIGLAKDVFLRHKLRWISVTLYFLMGWLVVIAFRPLHNALPPAGLAWLLAGGVAYTGGIVFFARSSKTPHAHGIWHIFVLIGSVAHYFAVLFYIVPATAA